MCNSCRPSSLYIIWDNIHILANSMWHAPHPSTWIHFIIESVDSISRDGPRICHTCIHAVCNTLQKVNKSEQINFYFYIYDLCQNTYLSKPLNIHGNNQVCLNKLCNEITKSANFSIFFLPGLTQDRLDLSP